MTQDFGCTGVLETQAHSKLRNCFSGAAVQSKDKSDSGIIEFSFLSTKQVFCEMMRFVPQRILRVKYHGTGN